MSYLPRMSKTYKEPEVNIFDESEQKVQPSGLQPASSLVSEKTFNPQLALKHYRYYPHPLPVLPGPSVAEEANESEFFREAIKLRRSMVKIEDVSGAGSRVSLDTSRVDTSRISLPDGTESGETDSVQPSRIQSKGNSLHGGGSKASTAGGTRKKSSKTNLHKKNDSSKPLVNLCLVETEVPDSLVARTAGNDQDPDKSLRREKTTAAAVYRCTVPKCQIRPAGRKSSSSSGKQKSSSRKHKSPGKEPVPPETVDRSVQCVVSASSDGTGVIPRGIIALLGALGFLLSEVDKSEMLGSEGKRIMNRIQSILGDLCNRKAGKEFGFEVGYSDSKRVEKFVEELRRYVRLNYGEAGEFVDRREELKKKFVRLKLKELELGILEDRLAERPDSLRRTAEVELKASDLKNPELTLQNKRLESEQLSAEVEFSRIELIKYQKSLAECDWEIKMAADRVQTAKRTSGSKSKGEVVARKPSAQRFSSSESPGKGNHGWDLASAIDPECLGICYGIIGKVQVDSIVEQRLLLIKEYKTVGEYVDGHFIYKIKSIAFLSMGDNESLNLTNCKKHQNSIFTKKSRQIDRKSTFARTLGAVKSATNTFRTSTQQAAALAIPQVKFKFISKDKDKFEKRLLDELNKIFTDTDSFYFSLTCDLTNSLQRKCKLNLDCEDGTKWQKIDDRFFWNKFMVHDLMNHKNALYDPWILPIIQGFVQIENCKVEIGCDFVGNEDYVSKLEQFKLILISRRSRHRAGTRYKRRGVDEEGHCANYVETEQILVYHKYKFSFVQIRGSVPVFWSQPGYKYRPPPRLDRGPAETQVVFEKHFQREIETYGSICIVNLVEQSGKEKTIWDAYTNHVLAYNEPKITYATFDFHEYCRGMRFENVSYLIASLADVVRTMCYCWTDQEGLICPQNGVFRVNCIDCLDRTNVVQTALAKFVLEIQMTKLGLIPPEGQMSSSVRNVFQSLWANNGDIISKQYTGTNALKGDYTRTGERKFSGLMKDGMNSANRYWRVHLLDSYRQAALDLSQGKKIETIDLLNKLTNEIALASNDLVTLASVLLPKNSSEVAKQIPIASEIIFSNAVFHVLRYYLSRFKDAYRQASIDMMCGNDISEEIFNPDQKEEEEDSSATAEHVKLLIEDSKKLLINNPDSILGSWGLIDADLVTGDPTETDMDTILILTRDAYYVADYDEQVDRVTKYQKIDLTDVTLIELGPNTIQSSQVGSMFKFNKSAAAIEQFCIRIHYVVAGEDGYFHMFRSTNLRFFNNMIVVIKSAEEMYESLKAICETFIVAFELAQLPPVMYIQGKPMEKKKSKLLDPESSCRLGSYLDLGLTQGLTRNISETQLVSFKTAGTKALNNITQQFSKINKLGQSLRRNQNQWMNKVKNLPSPSPAAFLESQNSQIGSRRSSDNSLDGLVDPHLRIRHVHRTNVGILMKNENPTPKFPSAGGNHLPNQIGFLLRSPSKFVDLETVSTKSFLQGTKSDDLNFGGRKCRGHREAIPRNVGNRSAESKLSPPKVLNINRQLSRSANEIEEDKKRRNFLISPADSFSPFNEGRSNSEKDLNFNMATSQSENALRSLRANIANVITSPASATREMLSPLSKLAKGVHTLGANLDPRKFRGVNATESPYKMTELHLEDLKRLEERWKNCHVKLIAL